MYIMSQHTNGHIGARVMHEQLVFLSNHISARKRIPSFDQWYIDKEGGDVTVLANRLTLLLMHP